MEEKLGRNNPCHCGSGKKYKKCCYANDRGPRKLNAKVLNSGSSLFSNVVAENAKIKKVMEAAPEEEVYRKISASESQEMIKGNKVDEPSSETEDEDDEF